MIVLHTTRYSDSSLIIHLYRKEEGRESVMLKKVGKGGNIALLHPLSIIEGEVSESRRGSLKYIKEITAPYGLHTIRYDFNKSAIAIFISELLYRTLITGQSDPILYDFIENAIIALERSSSTANFPIWFLYHYTALLGFPPKRGFESEYNPFTPLQRDILDNIQQYPSHEAMDFPLKGKTRTEFAENFIRYIGYHLGIRIQMKSLPVLHSLFSATIETSSNDTD